MAGGFQIVVAQPEDAGSMLQIQALAVRAMTEGVYEAATLEEWASSLTGRHVQGLTERMRAGTEEALLAVTKDEGVLGVGSIVPASSRLRTLYVDPTFSGRGVGTAILLALLEKAKGRGLTHLSLESSLNAVAFYQRHGFAIDQEGSYVLPSGTSMRCAYMTKLIAASLSL
jgi:GNAT superfamily N-acetyltransferase